MPWRGGDLYMNGPLTVGPGTNRTTDPTPNDHSTYRRNTPHPPLDAILLTLRRAYDAMQLCGAYIHTDGRTSR